MIPKFAKAAAVLVFTSGVPDHATAAVIYDQISAVEDDTTVQDILDKHPGVCIWGRVENMDDAELWNEITCLAESITEAHRKFNGE